VEWVGCEMCEVIQSHRVVALGGHLSGEFSQVVLDLLPAFWAGVHEVGEGDF